MQQTPSNSPESPKSEPKQSENKPPPIRLASDSEFVEQLAPIEPRKILEALVSIPIETWNYKFEDKSIRHIGPMAQDFYAAFGMGANDKMIYHMDGIGVCMASIKGLYALLQEQGAQIAQLQEELSQQATQIDQLQMLINQGKV